MSHSFIQNCCWITACFTSSRMKEFGQKWKVNLIFRGTWSRLTAWRDWLDRPPPALRRKTAIEWPSNRSLIVNCNRRLTHLLSEDAVRNGLSAELHLEGVGSRLARRVHDAHRSVAVVHDVDVHVALHVASDTTRDSTWKNERTNTEVLIYSFIAVAYFGSAFQLQMGKSP